MTDAKEDISRGLEHLPQSELEATPGGLGEPKDAEEVIRQTTRSSAVEGASDRLHHASTEERGQEVED